MGVDINKLKFEVMSKINWEVNAEISLSLDKLKELITPILLTDYSQVPEELKIVDKADLSLGFPPSFYTFLMENLSIEIFLYVFQKERGKKFEEELPKIEELQGFFKDKTKSQYIDRLCSWARYPHLNLSMLNSLWLSYGEK